mmetsp:Transcript_16247/g.35243  ORF Transcript_16247/g.35243 Transcript_16247/m.35243 type:complete len:103 (-) Transcript_16247:54-362(-)
MHAAGYALDPKFQAVRYVQRQDDGTRDLVGDWFVYGHMKTKDRGALKHENADKLVFCHESIHLHDKLHTASYKEEVEKWDSDSESDDGSDDGEDFAKFARFA